VPIRGALRSIGGLESKASAFRPASTIARSSAGRLITVAQTKRRLGIDPARRLELEALGSGPGDIQAIDAVAPTGHGSARPCRLPGDRVAPLDPAAQVLAGRGPEVPKADSRPSCMGLLIAPSISVFAGVGGVRSTGGH